MIESLRNAARRLAAPMLDKGFKPEGIYKYTTADGKVTHARVRAKHPETGEKWIRPVTLNGETWRCASRAFRRASLCIGCMRLSPVLSNQFGGRRVSRRPMRLPSLA